MKKQSLIIATTIASLSLVTALAFAEDRGGDNERDQRNAPVPTLYQDTARPQGERGDRGQQFRKQEQDNENDQEDDNEDIDEQGLHQEESDLGIEINKIPDVKPTITLRTPDASTTATYADVVSLLNEYQKALDTISSPLTLASTTLSAQEQQLFSSLKAKHSFELGRTSVRAQELRSQITDLLALVTPLGSQTISEVGGLKRALFGVVNDIRSAILDVGDLHDKSNDILYEETN